MRNTAFLTFRMLIVTFVSLYTARVVINALGIEDFGIYNVVGGIIGFLGILNVSLISATQRYLSFELGNGEKNNFNKILNLLVLIFFIIGFFSLALGFLLQSWIIDDVLVYPFERKSAVTLIYLFSLGSFFLNLLSIPYMSSVIANERMDIFAYIGLIEAGLKLIIAWMLTFFQYDKLILYGLLNFLVTFVILLFYFIYNLIKINNTELKFYWEPKKAKEIFKFSGWILFGSFSSILNLNGQAVLLNIFFGPVVNAGKSVSDRIGSVMTSFSNNFYTAVRPQLVKNFACGHVDKMINLAFSSSKYSFYIQFLITIPFLLFAKELLVLWLGNSSVTNEMIVFTKLVLIYSLINVLEQPITVMIQATGYVKRYEVLVNSISLTLLPLSYVAFKLGAPSFFSMCILIVLHSLAQFCRLYVAKYQIGISILLYMRLVVFPIIIVTIVFFVGVYFGSMFFDDYSIYLKILFLLIFLLIIIYVVGLKNSERLFFLNVVKRKLGK